MERFEVNEIEFSVDGHQASAVAWNGGLVIQVPQGGAQWVGTNADGSAKNVPGSNGDQSIDRQHFIDRVMKPGDTVLLWRDAANNGSEPWVCDWPEDGNVSSSRNRVCVPVAFVAYEPVEGQFFPPAVGRLNNPLIEFGRSLRITREHVNLGVLPRLFRLGDWIPQENTPLTFELLAKSCKPFAGEYVSGSWGTASFTPGIGNEGYGQYVAAWTSRRMLFLCSDATDEEKIDLAMGVVQRGLSLATAYIDGKVDMANGGHFQGRTPMMIMAGKLLNLPPLLDPRWLGNRFQERLAYYEDGRSWWHNSDWTSLWQRTSDYRWGGHPIRLDISPDQWTEGHGGEKWALQGYYQPTCASNLGTAIAMRLMKADRFIGLPFVNGILDQYMVGPGEDADRQLRDAGVTIPWGSDFPGSWTGVGVQKQAYEMLKRDGHL